MAFRVPETDPAQIADLWETVRSTMPSETRPMAKAKANDGRRGGRGRGKSRGGRDRGGRGRGGRDRVGIGVSRGGGQNNSRKRRHNADESDDEEQTIQTKFSEVTSHNLQFYSLVLLPRRIVEIEDEPIKSACSHFGTTAPTPLDYTKIAGLDVAGVWLSLSDNEVEHIIEEYKFMARKSVCEQEYVTFAMETLFRRQHRSLITPSDRKWRVERMLRLVSPPAKFWVAPPSFEDCQEFKFDLRPDCSYWLSLTGFSPDYQVELKNVVHVHESWVIWPYLTIEFKKHGQPDLQAPWQACAAASMGLYNRYLLKCKALAIKKKDWTDSDKLEMKHYILTFVGASYNVWVLRVRFSEDSVAWDGCQITNLWRSECAAKSAVRGLESWINEIHRWALLIHAVGCQADVKILLQNIGIEGSPVNN